VKTVLRQSSGATIPLDLARWRAEPDPVERWLLATLPDPVLDIGCGPGRITAALAARGRPVLGIDPSSAAVAEAGRRGAATLRRSVFDRLPGERRWGAALLLDGNIGIGGDPAALLARVAGLLRPGGEVLAEVEPPGVPTETLQVRIEAGPGRIGPWFPWSRVGADDIAELARSAGLTRAEAEPVGGGRWLARARRP
jgi:SAM-dependent methyltransferase